MLTQDYEFLHCKESDSGALVSYANSIGGETDNLTFGKGEFHMTEEDEAMFIRDLNAKKSGLLMCAKVRS